MNIDFHDATGKLSKQQKDLLKRLLQFVALKEKVVDRAEVSVNIVDNSTMQSLNLQYRQKDEPTDVLSFAMLDSIEAQNTYMDKAIPILLGDIVISLEIAQKQAEDFQHSLERELGFLVVHGFLHLLGYDHATKPEEEIMFAKQKKLLEDFGLERLMNNHGGT